MTPKRPPDSSQKEIPPRRPSPWKTNPIPISRKESAAQIAKTWVQQDRADTLEWAATLTEPAVQGEAWQAIAQHWLEEDPHEASRWISTLPTGGARDAAVLTMARHIQDSDPDLSWKWALTVGDPVLKIETLRQVTQSWNRRDAAAARRALENSGLSTAMQRGILTEPSTSSAK